MSIARRQLSPKTSKPLVATCSGIVCQKLEIEGFQGIPRLTVDLPEKPGLYWVTGEHEGQPRLGANGVGKTSLLNALTWVCTGSTGDGVSGPRVVNSAVRTALVEASFTDNRVIERTQNPNSLTMNDVAYDPKSFAEAFGCTWEVWSQTVHHAQGERLFLDLSPAERAQVLSDLLGLELWERLADDAKAAARECDKEVRTLDNGVHRLKGQVQTYQEGVAMFTRQKAAWEKERADAQRLTQLKVEALQNDIAANQTVVKLAEDEERGVELRLKRADSRVAFLQSECEKLTTLLGELRSKQSDLVVKQSQPVAEHNAAIARQNLARGGAKADFERLRTAVEAFDGVGPTCQACGQDVPESHRERHRKSLMDELAETERRYNQATFTWETLQGHLRELQRQQEKDREAIHLQVLAGEDTARKKRTELIAAQDAVRALRRQQSEAASHRAEAVQQLDRLRSQLERLNEPDREEEERGAQLDVLLGDTRTKLAEAERALREQELWQSEKQHELDAYVFWGKHYYLLRLRLMDQALAELTMLSTPYLDMLGLEGWTFTFTTQQATASGSVQQKLDIEICRPGETQPTAVTSGGERTRLRLAAQMALAAATVEAQKFGMEIWDEPSAYLSGSGLEDLLEVLSQRAMQERKAIFLVDHTVPDFAFDGILTLVKNSHGVTAQWTR